MSRLSPARAVNFTKQFDDAFSQYKENHASRANSPVQRRLHEDSLCKRSPFRDCGSPVPCKGGLEEAAIRRKAENGTLTPLSLASFKQSDGARVRVCTHASKHKDSHSRLDAESALTNEASYMFSDSPSHIDDDSFADVVCRKFQALSNALRQSSATQSDLQGYLECSLDECDRLRVVETDYKMLQAQYENMRGVEAEKQRLQEECERFRYEVNTARDETERLRKKQMESETLKMAQMETNNVERQKLQDECDRMRIELQQVRNECEHLRRLQADVEKFDAAEVEANASAKQKLQGELAAVQAELLRSQNECERMRAYQTEAKKVKTLELELGEVKDECKRLQASEIEARRARDQYHHKWCALDQERENLQRTAQQSRESERNARARENLALEEAAAWRRWLASFLDAFLRPGAAGFEDSAGSPSQYYEKRHPKMHALLVQLSKPVESSTPQPKLLSQLRTLYNDVSELIASGQLVVQFGGDHAHKFNYSDSAMDTKVVSDAPTEDLSFVCEAEGSWETGNGTKTYQCRSSLIAMH